MSERFVPQNRKRAAFTLVEIMIVVAVIGLLSAIAIPSLAKARSVARANKALGDLRVIAQAVEQLGFETGQWPGGMEAFRSGDIEIWDLNRGSAGIAANDGRFRKWTAPYVDAVPKDPWGMDYFFDPDYRIGAVNRVVVGCFGPNKRGRNVYDSDNIYIILK
jgi:type II secretion system protein G